MPSYSYYPDKIGENGKDRLRMELGDTVVTNGADTSALSDEEYNAIIKLYMEDQGKSFKFVKYKCLEAIHMKLSFEVDTTIGPLSYSLSARAKVWKEMYESMKKSMGMPSMGSSGSSSDGGHYFYTGMLENPYSK